MGLGRVNISRGTSASIGQGVNPVTRGNLVTGPNDGTGVNFKQLEEIETEIIPIDEIINRPLAPGTPGPEGLIDLYGLMNINEAGTGWVNTPWAERTPQEWIQLLSRAEEISWNDSEGIIPPQRTIRASSWKDIQTENIFEIIDIRSGESFNAYRTLGDMHMDVNPASPDDTAIINSLGNNWGHRPILIVFNDRVIKATMHTMPHGGGIRDTEFVVPPGGNGYSGDKPGGSGHFCIHLPDSTGHASGVPHRTHAPAMAEIPDRIESYIADYRSQVSPRPGPVPIIE